MSKKNFDLWDSDDEKAKKAHQKSIFDFDDEEDDAVVVLNTLKQSNKLKQFSLFGKKVETILPAPKSEKNVNLFNDVDVDLMSSVVEPAFESQTRSNTTKTVPLLFDEDDDDTPLKRTTKTVNKVDITKSIKLHNNLFDDDDDDDDTTPVKPKIQPTKHVSPTSANTGVVDFERLYNEEKTLRMALEQTVTRLHQEIAVLEHQLHSKQLIEPTSNSATVSGTDNHGHEASEITDTYELVDEQTPITATGNNNWEKLANEEKERKQRQRAMKSKPRPVSMSAKRLTASKLQSVVGDVEHAEAVTNAQTVKAAIDSVSGVSVGNSASNSQKSVAWDVSSSDEEDTLKVKSAKIVASATTSNTATATDNRPLEPERELTVEEVEAAAATAHWESLAALDRERKASARRHRPAPGASRPKSLKMATNILHTSGVGTSSNTTTSVSPIPHSVSGTNITGMVTSGVIGSSGHVPSSGGNKDLNEVHSDDSGWDSGAQSEEEDDEEEDPSLVATQQSQSQTSHNNTTNNNTNNITQVSSEIELEIDTRLLAWVRSCRGNITALLQTVHSVYRGSELPDLSEIWSGVEEGRGDDPVRIRKAYLKIVRHCHPDKQMHLDRRGREFVEASRVFTIISDSYNRYKASSGGGGV